MRELLTFETTTNLVSKLVHPELFKGIKIYHTRNKTLVVVFSSNGGGDCPILGAYYTGENEWIPAKWNPNGMYPSLNDEMYGRCGLDLMIDQNKESA